MAVPTVLSTAAGTAIGTTGTALYSVPSAKVFILKRITFYNSDATNPHTVTFYSASNLNTTLGVVTINPGSTATFPDGEGQAFPASTLLQAKADATGVYCARMTGLLVDA